MDKNPFERTAYEFLGLIFIGFAPVWSALLFTSKSFHDYFINGEAILLSASLVGPLIYKLYENTEPIKFKNGFKLNMHGIKFILMCCSLAICLIASGIVGFSGNNNKLLSSKLFSILSIILSFFAIIIWLVTTWYSRHVESSPTDRMRNDAQDYYEQYVKVNGVNNDR